jgi:hypothetical protein
MQHIVSNGKGDQMCDQKWGRYLNIMARPGLITLSVRWNKQKCLLAVELQG